MTKASNAENACCIWCGRHLDGAPDAASFLFLARRANDFLVAPEQWLDDSEHLEGHQFFCHASCFQQSVPESMQALLRFALHEE